MKRSLFFQILAVYICIHRAFSKDVDYEYEFDRAEPIFGDEETLVESNLKVIRKGKDYFINGTVIFTKDMDENYKFITETLHSPMMNSYFMKTPYRLPPSTLCGFLNTTYKEMLQSELLKSTNIPFVPEEGLCPYPKGTYFVKDFNVSYNLLPPHIPAGMWWFKVKFMLGNKCVGGYSVLLKVTPKL